MDDNESGRIERLRRRLYSRKNPLDFQDSRSDIKPEQFEVQSEWKEEEGAAPIGLALHARDKKKSSFFNRLFIVSLIFFLACVAVAAYVFFGGLNRISPNNVDIVVAGPVSVAAGNALPLDIIVKDNNALNLEDVSITVHFPDSTRSPDNLTEPLTTYTEDIGEVPAGGSVHRTVTGVFFGQKDDVQNVTVTATYKIKASTATYNKEKTYQIAIQSSPIIMTVSYPKEVNVGGDTEFDIDVSSNTNTDLNNMVLTADYPFGFVFASSDPAPTGGQNTWNIGTLKPLEKRTIKLHGTLEAEDNEERTFTFHAGTADPSDSGKIGVNLSTTQESLTVKKPEIELGIVWNGSKEALAVPASNRIQADIDYKNNLPVNLVNANIVAKISGPILDQQSVIPTYNGFFRSLDNTVTWDMNGLKDLAQVAPGADGTVGLTFASLPTTADLISKVKNPQITLDVTMTGSRVDSGGVPQTVTATLSKVVQVTTELGITQRAVYSVGPFQNTGPIPPKANTETTYTVIWDASNTFNDVSGAKVTAQLPPYVKWKGVISPSTEGVTYNALTNSVTWNIGNLPRGTGYTTSPKEVMFQIGMTPSITQVGTRPTLVNTVSISGADTFTKQQAAKTAPEVTTLLSTDPNVDAKNTSEVAQ
ncbi:MAG TPA: hypothetical protein VHF05_03420 [Candidatus Paceibacterota bacterium]|jgi:hypothetical protein|nr:hypothetical protein [Candidatus Paceibacterota bacterium]